MPFNINEFRAQFLTTGFTSPAHFEVRMSPPNVQVRTNTSNNGSIGVGTRSVGLVEAGSGFGDGIFAGVSEFFNGEITLQKLRFLCETASIPGAAILEGSYKDYGNPYKMAQSMTENSDFSMNIIVPKGFKLDKMINQWMNLALNCFPTTEGQNKTFTYDVGYYYDYIGSIDVYKYDQQGDIECIYTLHEAYPVQKAPMELSWEAENQIMKLPVTFSYRRWSVVYKDSPASILGPLNTILAGVNTVLGNI